MSEKIMDRWKKYFSELLNEEDREALVNTIGFDGARRSVCKEQSK